MLVIRTAEELARALTSSLDPTLRARLAAQCVYLADYLDDYAFEELGLFLIIQLGDQLEDLNAAGGVRLVRDGAFAFDVETASRYDLWSELLFVVSDDGFGVVLYVPLAEGIDPAILSACQEQAPHLEITTAAKASDH